MMRKKPSINPGSGTAGSRHDIQLCHHRFSQQHTHKAHYLPGFHRGIDAFRDHQLHLQLAGLTIAQQHAQTAAQQQIYAFRAAAVDLELLPQRVTLAGNGSALIGGKAIFQHTACFVKACLAVFAPQHHGNQAACRFSPQLR